MQRQYETMENEAVDMEKDPFKEYLRESESDKAHKGYAWSTAIGLQAVDGLKPSKYLIDTAIQNIEGKITMKEKEWVLDGATVMYGSASELRATFEYDFSQEKDFSYKGLSMDEIIHHLAVFISRLWQIHIFGEGNTRTTEYLELFLRNLLLNEQNELQNRNLHISGLLNKEKVDIQGVKVDIQGAKVDIESVLSAKGSDFTVKTTVHIHRLFEKFGFDGVFGRSAVMELLELKSSGASKLLSNLVQADIIEPVSGHGKGKYKFKK